MATLAGKNGYISLAATNYAFSSWSLDFTTDALDTTSFGSAGYRENIAGLTGGKVSASGPFNSTAMAVTSGSSYAFVLAVSATVNYAVTARVTSIKINTDVKDAVRVDIQAETTGTITAAIA